MLGSGGSPHGIKSLWRALKAYGVVVVLMVLVNLTLLWMRCLTKIVFIFRLQPRASGTVVLKARHGGERRSAPRFSAFRQPLVHLLLPGLCFIARCA